MFQSFRNHAGPMSVLHRSFCKPVSILHPSTAPKVQVTEGAQRHSTFDVVGDYVWGIVQAGCLAYVVFNYFMSSSVMLGPSMLPTFQPQGDVVLVERVSHRLGALKPGDIVTCISPENPREQVCKRLVALEGMPVAVPQGRPRGLAALLGQQPYELLEVPRGHVWLQGDNAAVSKDSRWYGPVPYAMLTGRVIMQVWPPQRARMLLAEPPHDPKQYAKEVTMAACLTR